MSLPLYSSPSFHVFLWLFSMSPATFSRPAIIHQQRKTVVIKMTSRANHISRRVCVCVGVCVCVCVGTCTCRYVCLILSVYLRVCVSLCVCLSLYRTPSFSCPHICHDPGFFILAVTAFSLSVHPSVQTFRYKLNYSCTPDSEKARKKAHIYTHTHTYKYLSTHITRRYTDRYIRTDICIQTHTYTCNSFLAFWRGLKEHWKIWSEHSYLCVVELPCQTSTLHLLSERKRQHIIEQQGLLQFHRSASKYWSCKTENVHSL